jgi:hypothetical protein
MREIVNGIFYVMRAGCAWGLMPSDLPRWGTIYRWFAAWRDDGCFERINHAFSTGQQRSGRSGHDCATLEVKFYALTPQNGKWFLGRPRQRVATTPLEGGWLCPSMLADRYSVLGFVFYTWGVRDLPTSELRSYTAFQRAEPQAASPLRVCLTANRSRCERPKRIA